MGRMYRQAVLTLADGARVGRVGALDEREQRVQRAGAARAGRQQRRRARHQRRRLAAPRHQRVRQDLTHTYD